MSEFYCVIKKSNAQRFDDDMHGHISRTYTHGDMYIPALLVVWCVPLASSTSRTRVRVRVRAENAQTNFVASTVANKPPVASSSDTDTAGRRGPVPVRR